MKILFAASECVPFCKTGGLADVVGALSPVLAKKGHDIRVIMPLYSAIPQEYVDQMTHVIDFEVRLGWRRQYCGIEELKKDGVTYYFIDNKYYFGRNYIYGLGGDEYERFGFFCRSVLNALPLIGFQPDVLHCHDWQSGMIPPLLKVQYNHLPFYHTISTVMTIHNLQYQGIFGIKEVQDILGLPDHLWTSDKLESYGCANFLKAGLVYADKLTTVSPSYAQEIQTAYYGERLDGLLKARSNDLVGILNGIDIKEYDPVTDQALASTYNYETFQHKSLNKTALQEKMGLAVRGEVPLIGMVGRLSNQKGLDLVERIIGDLMNHDIQLVVLGMGDSQYIDLFSWAEEQYPGRVATRFVMDHDLAHQIYGGADLFLMPSQFEPCGLSQMISMRYGTVPIVRETGGLRDTVLSYNDYSNEGNGFSFFNYNAHDMLNTILRAVDFFHHNKEVFSLLVKRGMETDFSWENSSEKYIELYQSFYLTESPIPSEESTLIPEPSKVVAKKKTAPALEKKKAPHPATKKKNHKKQ